ncbi:MULTISPECIES: phasin family protein [unclassified Bradyrhizobium]|uniref:phasin family protein n=1 Tax=unclassified Bradyrhizobium TaxID=2631580 RepID=UPI002FF2F436
MSNTDQGKPAGKSGRRKGKGERGKKAASQESTAVSPTESPAPVELQSPDQDQPPQPEPVHAESPKVDQPAVEEPVVVASPEPQPTAAPSPAEPAPVEAAPVEAAPAEAAPIQPAPVEAAVEPAPVSLQTIANAYRDYTRKSIEEFGSFVEQLSGVRSLDKAMTVQTEFVKRAYETSVAESQKICELHNRLARQTLDPFKGVTDKRPATHGKP